MHVRNYKASDFVTLKRMHEKMGVAYDFNLMSWPHRRIAENETEIIGALIARESLQVDLVLEREHSTPAERWERLQELARDGQAYALSVGLHHLHVFVPERIARSYGKRLETLGFNREKNPCWIKEI